MISFRFHLVSLVGVFLALGLGVLTGTTVLNRGIVAQLERQTDQLARDADMLREDVQELQSESEMWSAFGEEVMGPLLSGRLTDRQVVVVTQVGTDEEAISGVRRALEDAGADLVALLALSDRMALASASDREELAGIIGADGTEDPEELTAAAAGSLADRLAFGSAGSDVLEALIRADFVVDEGPSLGEAGLRGVGGPGQIEIVVAGGPGQSELEPADFLVPLVTQLAEAGSPVAAAEPFTASEPEPFVTLLRSDGDVSSEITTQDNVDQTPGQIGLVLAVEDLAEGVTGHYGFKDGATRPIPPL